jgi:TPR repeat protein
MVAMAIRWLVALAAASWAAQSWSIADACDPKDVAGCETACGEGKAVACHVAAEAYERGAGVAASSERAVELYLRACDGEFPWACYRLGELDPKRFRALYRHALANDEKSCSGDAADACARVGLLYREGRGVKRNLDRAERFLKTACKGGEETSCAHVAMIYLETGRTARSEEAADLLERACKNATPWACLELGRRLLRGDGVPADPARGERVLRDACGADQHEACVVLADERFGRGDTGSIREASTLYRRACKGGAASGCVRLGGIYERGDGMSKRDPKRAAQLFEQACGSFVGGCVRLGALLEAGDGVEKDEARARKLFRGSCDLGDQEGCLRLGLALSEGRGGEPDPAAARGVLGAICHKGHALGCQLLGDLYEQGLGGPKQKAKARTMYRQACRLGRQQACERVAPARRR